MNAAQSFLQQVTAWAAGQDAVLALALVGSWARGTARPDSDVDLVILTTDPQALLNDRHWAAAFGEVTQTAEEDWGRVRSLRIFYQHGLEVEFGITAPGWAQTQPLDPGTEQVARDGLQALYDPAGILQSLKSALQQGR